MEEGNKFGVKAEDAHKEPPEKDRTKKKVAKMECEWVVKKRTVRPWHDEKPKRQLPFSRFASKNGQFMCQASA